MSDQQPKKRPRKDRGKKHERPLTLAPLSFTEALDKLLSAKPPPKPPKKPKQ